jgi:hypothetical protein
MRLINNVEVAAISGGLDGRDLSGAMGAWIGYSAGFGLWNYSVSSFNVGAVLTGLAGAMTGAVVGRFADSLLDNYINPIVDQVVPV